MRARAREHRPGVYAPQNDGEAGERSRPPHGGLPSSAGRLDPPRERPQLTPLIDYNAAICSLTVNCICAPGLTTTW
jgi:hypothetical protein